MEIAFKVRRGCGHPESEWSCGGGFSVTHNRTSSSYLKQKNNLLKILGNFLGGPVSKNPPYNTWDSGSIPGQEIKIPHASKQVKPASQN